MDDWPPGDQKNAASMQSITVTVTAFQVFGKMQIKPEIRLESKQLYS